jgi:hypothetical protein
VSTITRLLTTGLLTWFVLLALLIVGRVLRGEIGAAGLLSDAAGSGVTPERVVAMAVFPTVVIMYTITALHVDVATAATLPEIPDAVVTLLAGSNSLYLAGKIARKPTGGT